MMNRIALLILVAFLGASAPTAAQATGGKDGDQGIFSPKDIFELEWASDPQISPDGTRVVYVRNFFDVMTDRSRSNLWIVNFDGTDHRPLTKGNLNYGSPRWSPDGQKLLYVSSEEGSAQIYLRWMDTGQTAKLTNLTVPPGGLSWSPDGEWIAFSMLVSETAKPMVQMPPKPRGAEWAPPARVIDRLVYRADGVGYLPRGYTHLFVLPVEGGTPRQVTFGPYNHDGAPAWSPDGGALYFSSSHKEDWEYDPADSEVYRVSLNDGTVTPLTDRHGPDNGPVVSPDGRLIAYLGMDERYQGYQLTRLYVMNRDGTDVRLLAPDLDRSLGSPRWSGDGSGLFIQYDDHGNTKIAFASLDGSVEDLAAPTRAGCTPWRTTAATPSPSLDPITPPRWRWGRGGPSISD